MELELHLVVSAAVILGTALVALIVDYLKGANEQLREHNIELRVRREEEHRRAEFAAAIGSQVRRSVPGRSEAAAATAPAAAEERTPPVHVSVRTVETPQAEGSVREVLERAAMRAARAGAPAPAPAVEAEAKTAGPPPGARPSAAESAAAETEGEGLLEQIIASSATTGPAAGESPKPTPATPEPAGVSKTAPAPEAEVETVYLPARPSPATAERVVTVTPLRTGAEMSAWSAGAKEVSSRRAPFAQPAPSSWPPVEEPRRTEEPPPDETPAAAAGFEAVEALSALVEVAAKAEAPAAPVAAVADEVAGQGEAPPEVEKPVAVTAAPVAEVAAEIEATAAVETAPAEEPTAEAATAGDETPIEPVTESAEPGAPEPAGLLSLPLPARQVPATAAKLEADVLDWPRSPADILRQRPSGLDVAGNLADLVRAPEVEAPRPGPVQLPAGYHGRQAAQEVLRSEGLFTGFAVCISLNDFERIRKAASSNAFAELMSSIEKLMRSLLREGDFGCRISDDEFLLAYPDLTGSAAQRRASHISERLWDFQLRSLGSFSVLFSWGGLDVQDEPFSEVVESAVERMNDTRNSRRSGRSGVPALAKRLAS